jgi:seryl-tRNA synthetase
LIDIALVRTNPDLVRQTCLAKESDVDVERLIFVDSELRRLTVHMEGLRAKQKKSARDTPREEAIQLKEELREAHRAGEGAGGGA